MRTRREQPEPDLPAREREQPVVESMLLRLRQLAPDSVEAGRLRTDVVLSRTRLVHYLVRGFAHHGEDYDDLVQVATIGLLNAVDRFEPERGVDFDSFAVPTIVGELRRHLRDTAWALRVPRRLKERAMQVSAASTQLFARLRRSPTVAELGAVTGLEPEEVIEAMDSARAFTATSLDAENGDQGLDAVLDDPTVTGALQNVEYRQTLRPALARLAPRDRQVLALRFFGGWSQSQIAAEVGVSQVQISRILTRALAQLRRDLGEPHGPSALGG